MRALTACQACRSRRRKCEITPGNAICVYCTIRNIPCIKKDLASTSPNEYPEPLSEESPSTQLSNGSSPVISPDLQLQLSHLYFDFIHDCYHTLFHRPTFIEAVQNGTASPVIVFAMMALSARFSVNDVFAGVSPRERGDSYYRMSVALLDLRDVSLVTVQASVLLGAFCICEGESGPESIYYSVACRTANLMDLARRPVSDSIEREINVRVWNSLCMIDVWSSTGVGLPRQMVRDDTVDLPIDEATFLGWDHGLIYDEQILAASRTSSLQAQMIKLNRILMEINDTIRYTVENSADSIILEHSVNHLSMKLDLWYAELPAEMVDTPENFHYWAAQGFGRLFAAVYLGYYHFGQLLFYQFLHEDCHSGLSNAPMYSAKCKAHAANLCKIVYQANQTPDCSVLYTMVGHILVIASTVQIHTLLFDADEKEISAAKARLERNFATLCELRTYWPTLEVCFVRLRVFHEVCRNNMDSSFRMDRWMLRFLSDFAGIVDEDKGGMEMGLMSVANIGMSPTDWI